MPSDRDPRLDAAIAAIDAANAAGPDQVTFHGEVHPKEVLHAQRVTHWLHQLDQEPGTAQLVAARAAHLRRWALPRSDYPAGRRGYHRWRTDQQRRHATEVGDILSAAGYDQPLVDRVGQIIRKQDRQDDPEVQTHEDALCLTFLELQLGEIIDQLGSEKAIDVVRRSLAKMSPRAIEMADRIRLDESEAAVVAAAVGGPAGPVRDQAGDS